MNRLNCDGGALLWGTFAYKARQGSVKKVLDKGFRFVKYFATSTVLRILILCKYTIFKAKKATPHIYL